MATVATADGPRKTVDKAMRVLHAFSGERLELSIGELSAELGIHKSVVSRLVSALREWRMLDKDPVTGRIRIGAGAFRVGALFANRDSLVRVSTAHMGELVRQTRHSAHVCVLDGRRILVVGTVESPSALRVIMRVGDQRYLHTTAAGKLFLAFSDEPFLDSVCRDPGLVACTAETLTSRKDLEKTLARVRREGISWNRGEHTAGAGAVAAPIHDATGRLVAALSTVYPLNVVDEEARTRIARHTATAAKRISHELGSTQ